MCIKASDLSIGDIVADTNRIALQTRFRVVKIDGNYVYMKILSGNNSGYRLNDDQDVIFSRVGDDWVLIEKSTPINPKKDLKVFNF